MFPLIGLLLLPCNNNFKPLKGSALMGLQQDCTGLSYIIVDERSMVGRVMLGRVDARLQEGMGKPLLYGGVNVIFLGDDHQLPPVKVLARMGGLGRPHLYSSWVIDCACRTLLHMTRGQLITKVNWMLAGAMMLLMHSTLLSP